MTRDETRLTVGARVAGARASEALRGFRQISALPVPCGSSQITVDL
jgi:hypothetical protein